MSFHLSGVNFVQTGVNVFQFLPVIGVEITTAGDGRDIFKGLLIQCLLTDSSRVPDSNRVYNHTVVAGDLGSTFGWYKAAGVVAIGEDYQDTFFDLTSFKQVDRQSHGIAQHGSRSEHANLCFFK